MGIGYPRCGTDRCYRTLLESDLFNVSKFKEVNYFLSKNFNKDNINGKIFKIDTLEEYKKLFNKKQKLKIEFSNQYIYELNSLYKIKKKFNNIKIIVFVRDPLDYIKSMYIYLKNSNLKSKINSSVYEQVMHSPKNHILNINHCMMKSKIFHLQEIFEGKNIFIFNLNEYANSKKNEKKIYLKLMKFLKLSHKNIKLISYKNETKIFRYDIFNIFLNTLFVLISSLKLDSKLNYILNTNNIFKSIYRSIFLKPSKKENFFKIDDMILLEKILKDDIKFIKDLKSGPLV